MAEKSGGRLIVLHGVSGNKAEVTGGGLDIPRLYCILYHMTILDACS